MSRLPWALPALLLIACSNPSAEPSSPAASDAPPASVAVGQKAAPQPSQTAPSQPPPAPTPSATAPAASAAAAAPAASASASGFPFPADPPPEALPKVKVANIGMHIGGGPNDDATKEPIKRSVQPHFDEFRRCYALLDAKDKGDFGVDLRIARDGGKAKVTKPRTALKGKGFTECMVKVFEGIDFLKPKTGDTVVSYSLRFTP